ncbi:MAG: hypothetical protein M3081_18315 [Gemmatimonadota bacterium]|nr:hypothetical protein [Gemmatimonadota bacterium]
MSAARGAARVVILGALVLLNARLVAQTPAPLASVRMGVTVVPETLSVGDRFAVRVRVQAPAGSVIQFPITADSGKSWEQSDPRALTPHGDQGALDQTATYRLVAWDTGTITPKFADVIVKLNGAERHIPIADVHLYVRTVLPADTTLRVPKGERDIVMAPIPWWWWWPYAVAALILLLIIWLLVWWWRRRRNRVAPPDAFGDAEREFERIDALGLLEAGERGRFVALNIEVLRDYLAARVVGAHRALTSGELLTALRSTSTIPASKLAPVLQEADLIKFARRSVSEERAAQLAGETRTIVREVEDRTKAEELAAREREERERSAKRPAPPASPQPPAKGQAA